MAGSYLVVVTVMDINFIDHVTDWIILPVTTLVHFCEELMVERMKTLVVRRVPARRKNASSPMAPLGAPSAPALWSATIRGEPTPQARLHDILLTDGTARLINSRPARIWQNLALPQLLNRRPLRPLAHDLALDCRFWSSSRRPAIDEGLVIETLERAAIIAHGRQICEKHVFAAVDRDDPRITVSLAPIGGGK
jgi:hypothetical protein